jgi:hypothetical protein
MYQASRLAVLFGDMTCRGFKCTFYWIALVPLISSEILPRAACLSSMNYMLSFLIACHRVHVDIMVKVWCFFFLPP